MSEFSESWHLAAGDVADGVALLERAGLPGWVFPSSGGWVTVVPEGHFGLGPVDALRAANTGFLVHFLHAEDHGWSMEAWAGELPIGRYEIEWTWDEPEVVSALDVDRFAAAADEAVDGLALDRGELRALLDPDRVLSMLERLSDPAPRVADLLGWREYAWLSGDTLHEDPGDAVRVH